MHVFDLTVYKESSDDSFHAWAVQSETFLKVDHQFESYLCMFHRQLQRWTNQTPCITAK